MSNHELNKKLLPFKYFSIFILLFTILVSFTVLEIMRLNNELYICGCNDPEQADGNNKEEFNR